MQQPIGIKDKSALAYIEYLQNELETAKVKLDKFEKSPKVKTYLTIYNQLDSFNEQLTIGESTQITVDGIVATVQKGKIDLFAEKEDKSFDRTKWYFEHVLDLSKTLDELRKGMNPDESKEVERKLLSQSVTEKYIFNKAENK